MDLKLHSRMQNNLTEALPTITSYSDLPLPYRRQLIQVAKKYEWFFLLISKRRKCMFYLDLLTKTIRGSVFYLIGKTLPLIKRLVY